MGQFVQDFEDIKRQLGDDSFVKEVLMTRCAATSLGLLVLYNFPERTHTQEFSMMNTTKW